MCIITIAKDCHPDFPLIIAANRDEFYDRNTAPLDFWGRDKGLLAGRDLKEGGTWLGVSRSGRIAGVTNFRAPMRSGESPATGMRSRGRLVVDFLETEDPPEEFLGRLLQDKDRYQGFNLVFGNIKRIFWYSNVAGRSEILNPGIHVISNHLLNTAWPKAEKMRANMTRIIENRANIHAEKLFAMLSDRKRAADHLLPDTGVGRKWERILSSIFVTSEIYGTRSSSVILADRQNTITFWERTYEVPVTDPPKFNTKKVTIRIEPAG